MTKANFSRILCLLSAFSAISAVNPCLAAEAPITIENLRVGFVETPSAGAYRVGAWTPIGIDLKAGAERFRGFVEVLAPDDNGTMTIARRPIDVPNDKAMHSYVVYTRMGNKTAAVRARVRDERGRVRGAEVENNAAEAIEATQTVVAVLGSAAGVADVPTLPAFSSSGPNASAMPASVVVQKVRSPGGISGQWFGYDGADAVVLDTSDRNVMDALNQAGKGQALADWVRNGGHLVVALGREALVAADPNGFLARILPALPRQSVPLKDLGALESFAGATGAKGRLPEMSVVALELVPGRGGQVLAATAATPSTLIAARGPYGFGRVTVVGLDVDAKPFSDWAFKKDFWVKALDLRGRSDTATNVMTYTGGGGAFYQTAVGDLSSLLHLSLERFPGVKLVPFGWVAFFVFLYILLIGPGDYFFLKKVLKRMELTWITFPLIVVGVSVLAYVGAYAVKGTDLRVNKIDVIDVDQATGRGAHLRGTSWLTLFSPRNRDYTVSVIPLLSPDADPKDPAAAPPRKAPPGAEPLVSWFGGAEAVWGGNDRLSLSGSAYSYGPPGEAERLEDVRVAIWSTKSFQARWSAPCNPVVTADLQRAGPDRLAGTITNGFNRELRDVWVAFGTQCYLFPTIAPGETVRVETAPNRVLGQVVLDHLRSFQQAQNTVNYAADGQVAPLPRASLVRAAMFRDAMASREAAPGSVPLRYLDLTGQLALERPILVAEVNVPGSALHLDGGGTTAPIVDTTTVLRVLLPLAPEGGAAGR